VLHLVVELCYADSALEGSPKELAILFHADAAAEETL